MPGERIMRFGSGDREIAITVLAESEEYGLAGAVEGKLLPGMVAIKQDNTPRADRKYDVAALQITKQGSDAAISLELEICEKLKDGESLALFAVFHELGHYVHGHALRRTNNSDYEENRKALAREGTAHPNELEADAFAAEYLGTDRAISGLEELKKYAADDCQTDKWDPEDIDTMFQEINIRIEKLKDQ